MKLSLRALFLFVGSAHGFTNFPESTTNKQCRKNYFHDDKIRHNFFMAAEDAADTVAIDEFGRAIDPTAAEKKSLFAKVKIKSPFQKTKMEEELETGQQELHQEEQKLKEDIIRQKFGANNSAHENADLSQEEKAFRMEMESMISDLTKEYEEKQQELAQKIQALNSTGNQFKDDIKKKALTRKYEDKQQKLDKTVRTLTLAKTKLDNEIQQHKDIQVSLKNIVEINRDLEDEYELGQNDKTALVQELIETKEQLQTISRQLNVTQEELIQAKRETEITDRSLLATATSLVHLQNEQDSLRKLGKKMLNLSMNRIKKRIIRKKEEGQVNNE